MGIATTIVSVLLAASVSRTEVHRFVAIHGSAAHLALMAIAPLFLCPFVTASAAAAVMFALLPLALVWFFMEPSVYPGEKPHHARHRVVACLARDPLVWMLLALEGCALLAAINVGVDYIYDVEMVQWKASAPRWSFLPGSVDLAGWLPTAKVAMLAVSVLAVRHVYGRNACSSFLLLLPSLSGIAGLLWLFFRANHTPECVLDGTVCGFALLLASVASLRTFEQRIAASLPLLFVSYVGNLVGLVAFSSAVVSLTMLSVWVLFSGWLIVRLRGRSVFFGGIGYPIVVLGAMAVAYVLLSSLAGNILAERLNDYSSMKLFEDGYFHIRALLSECARVSWMDSPWIGTGVGSFGIDMRLNLEPKDWAALPAAGVAEFNGCWKLLAERGIVGMTFLAVPFAFLLFGLGRAVAAAKNSRRLSFEPTAVAGPLALAAAIALSFFCQGSLTVEALTMVMVMMELSVRTVETKLKGDE